MHFMTRAHRAPSSTCEVPKSTWPSGSFSNVLHTLKLAYTSHLKTSLHEAWDDTHAASVRHLGNLVKTKLRHLCDADVVQLGEEDLETMLTQFQNEFRYMICTEVFEECAARMRTQKDEAFAKAKEAETRLKRKVQEAQAEAQGSKRRKTLQRTER